MDGLFVRVLQWIVDVDVVGVPAVVRPPAALLLACPGVCASFLPCAVGGLGLCTAAHPAPPCFNFQHLAPSRAVARIMRVNAAGGAKPT